MQRQKYLDMKSVRFLRWKKISTNRRLYKSFLKNFFLEGSERLTFIFQKTFVSSDNHFYRSQNKLQCLFSYSFSVPSKRLHSSRFYLNKGLDRLVYSGYQT